MHMFDNKKSDKYTNILLVILAIVFIAILSFLGVLYFTNPDAPVFVEVKQALNIESSPTPPAIENASQTNVTTTPISLDDIEPFVEFLQQDNLSVRVSGEVNFEGETFSPAQDQNNIDESFLEFSRGDRTFEDEIIILNNNLTSTIINDKYIFTNDGNMVTISDLTNRQTGTYEISDINEYFRILAFPHNPASFVLECLANSCAQIKVNERNNFETTLRYPYYLIDKSYNALIKTELEYDKERNRITGILFKNIGEDIVGELNLEYIEISSSMIPNVSDFEEVNYEIVFDNIRDSQETEINQ